MVLLILAVIWGFVAISWLRDRVGGTSADSIGAFHRQLHMLQRAAPTTGAAPVGPSLAPVTWSAAPLPPAKPSARTIKRRRDVFLTLLAAMAGSLVIGLIPGLRLVLVAHVLLDLLFAGYVALLVYLRNLAAERQTKVRYLPSTFNRPVPVEPLLLRRSATN